MPMIRIVKMTFRPEECDHFLEMFHQYKERIRAQEGCSFLELWRDINNPSVFFTHSHWDHPDFLEKYRNSELFQEVWAKTKALFDQKAEAWSVNSEVQLE